MLRRLLVEKKFMDIKTVCLGMLTDGEASGYDLKKRFESSFGHFFPAGYGSIYPALSTLARNGLVEFEQIPQDGKPDRKVYTITEKGRQELLAGLANPNPSHKVRSEFLATLWFAQLLTDEQISDVLENKIGELNEFLELIEVFASDECPDTGLGAQFVAGFGKHMASEFKKYIAQNRHLLTNPEEINVKSATG